MNEENSYQEKNKSEKLTSRLDSPSFLLMGFKKLIFGKENPEKLNRFVIYVNLIIWFIFLIWHLLSYSAISYRDVILNVKKINVEILILNRGSELAYDPSVFLNRLLNFHKLSILCWTIIFVGIVMMWRKKQSFKYFIGIPLFFYFSLLIFYMGIDYFKNDTTLFDKISVIIFVINSFLYVFLIKSKSVDFFMEEEN